MNREVSPRATLAIFIVLIAAIVGAGALLLASRPAPVEIIINPPLPTGTPAPTPTPAPVLVYITGAVNTPEITVTLPPGSRVADALAAAGGVTDSADLARVNVAAVLRDGDQVHVPALAAADAETALPTPPGGVIIYINTATLDELQTLPGIGPALAQRIVDFRTAQGGIDSLATLDTVEGIGPALLAELEPLISFER
ncbi:MAG: ComEA family DNA-binding protein [Anaerolineae bacterium]|jgi:competence protein ComEA|nr:ComEA family DNA-binding protein [Anaerolineae bacterium]